MKTNDILKLISEQVFLDTNIKISELTDEAGQFKDYTIEHYLVDYKITLLFAYGKITNELAQNLKELYNYRLLLEKQLLTLYINDSTKLDEIKLKEELIKRIDVELKKYHLIDLEFSIAETIKKNILLERYESTNIESMNKFVKRCKESIHK